MGFDLKEEQKPQAYKETMNIYIWNINTIEKRNKLCTTQWRKIYEVIEPEFLKEIWHFPDDFIKNIRIMNMNLIIYHLR